MTDPELKALAEHHAQLIAEGWADYLDWKKHAEALMQKLIAQDALLQAHPTPEHQEELYAEFLLLKGFVAHCRQSHALPDICCPDIP